MKFIIINGTLKPSTESNTSVVCEMVKVGFEKVGHECEIVNMAELNYKNSTEDEDDDLRDAGKNFTTLIPGAALVHHADSFALARGGRLDCAVLGAFQVAANGDLANWRLPQDPTGNIGGAMDIATGANEVFAMMTHATKNGESKLAETLTYPVTALACVTKVFTDMAVISVTEKGYRLDETAPGISADVVQAFTDAPLQIADTLCDIAA